MKKIFLAAALLAACAITYQKADAQISLSLGANIDSQPEWGPVGYEHVSYYYMPDADTYYDVQNHQYVYSENNRWICATALPARYHFDPYNSYKVVINDRNPWERATSYRTRYARYKGNRKQVIIRDSREVKYKNHWQGDRGHDDHRGPGKSDYGHDKDAHGRGNDHGSGHDHDE